MTYHPILNSLSKIIRDNMYLLNMNEEVRKTFSLGPMVSFRSTRKLSDYLVRAKLYPLPRKVGYLINLYIYIYIYNIYMYIYIYYIYYIYMYIYIYIYM